MASELFLLPVVLIVLFFLFVFVIAILGTAFWIWMIVDVARRKFKNENERIAWILVVVLAQLIGAVIYYFVVRVNNPRGVSK
jgi:hypothetical protein